MKQTFTIEQLAKMTSSEFVGNPTHVICGVDDIHSASLHDATFISNLKYKDALHSTMAGVICVDKNFALVEGKNYLLCANPSETFQRIAEAIINEVAGAPPFIGVHPTAVIDPSATIKDGVHIGPNVVVDKDAMIDSGTIVYPGVYIGQGVQIGKDCTLHANVVIRERCSIGNRVILQPGAVIGSCGYGYITDKSGRHIKLEQIGSVILEDDVEIGANTTVDRARFKETRIRRGSKIDNLVQIGHNVEIGEDNLIVSQTGIAGSSKTGRHVMMGGQVGIVGHVELGDGVMIATRGGVSKSIKTAGAYGGSPVVPIAEYNKQQVLLRKIETYVSRIKSLETSVKELFDLLLQNLP